MGLYIGIIICRKISRAGSLSCITRHISYAGEADINWFYQKGAHEVYPDHWDAFISDIPIQERNNILAAFHNRIHGKNKDISLNLCKKWAAWEGKCSTLLPSKSCHR